MAHDSAFGYNNNKKCSTFLFTSPPEDGVIKSKRVKFNSPTAIFNVTMDSEKKIRVTDKKI